MGPSGGRYHGVLAPAAKWRASIVPGTDKQTAHLFVRRVRPVLYRSLCRGSADEWKGIRLGTGASPQSPGPNSSRGRVFEADVLACDRCGGRLARSFRPYPASEHNSAKSWTAWGCRPAHRRYLRPFAKPTSRGPNNLLASEARDSPCGPLKKRRPLVSVSPRKSTALSHKETEWRLSDCREQGNGTENPGFSQDMPLVSPILWASFRALCQGLSRAALAWLPECEFQKSTSRRNSLWLKS